MALEPSEVGGDGDSHVVLSRRPSRWPSSDKVYRRRSFKRPQRLDPVSGQAATGPPVLPPSPGSQPLPSQENVGSATGQVVEEAEQPLPVEEAWSSDVREQVIEGDRVRIRVSTWLRFERRGLRRRLAEELERVRCFLAGIDPDEAPEAAAEMTTVTVERLPEVEFCQENGVSATPTIRSDFLATQDETFDPYATESPEKEAYWLHQETVTGAHSSVLQQASLGYGPLEGSSTVVETMRGGNAIPGMKLHYWPHISSPAEEMIGGAAEVVTPVLEKEKRTPKANQFYGIGEFVTGKEKVRPIGESNKKSNSKGKGTRLVRDRPTALAFKQCMILVTRLIKNKFGWVFDKPVDVVGLGLYDYHGIIKHPMDLGTVKSKIEGDCYHSPDDFAADVRLTFQNAMKYNAPHHEVHIIARQLLNSFEEKWSEIDFEYARNLRLESSYGVGTPTYMTKKTMAQSLSPESRTLDWSRSTYPCPAKNKESVVTLKPVKKYVAGKKPKANDPNKREMTFQEKQKLCDNLLELPPEKQEHVLLVLKRRNKDVEEQNEWFEVDIESYDVETLWELDRLVSNFKKNLSKIRKREEIVQAEREASTTKVVSFRDPIIVNGEAQEEIGTDGKGVPHSLPAQLENNGDAGSDTTSSGSSSESDSSSSDSDSESSSSDSDGRHSPNTRTVQP